MNVFSYLCTILLSFYPFFLIIDYQKYAKMRLAIEVRKKKTDAMRRKINVAVMMMVVVMVVTVDIITIEM